jgi:hydrogenase expression/formation protein HypD
MNPALDFSNSALARQLVQRIREIAPSCGRVNLMEVCGTHTMAIARLGLRALLPSNVRLLSGPGCPVCVTPASVVDAAADCALKHGATVLTFGDMVRVPGSTESLQQVKARGGRVDVVSSPLQAVEQAKAAPGTAFVFIAVGFETTIPAVALAVQKTRREGVENLSFLVSHRLVPPALKLLMEDPDLNLSGMLAPGHVSAILGEAPYAALKAAGIPTVIAGFEPLDVLGGLVVLLQMLADGVCEVKNMYPRIVRPEGNPQAVDLIQAVFEPVDAHWRGIGQIPESGLALRPEYQPWDAEHRFNLDLSAPESESGCRCGSVLLGHILPDECPLFGTACTPGHPIGACMVSGEGSCAAYFKYQGVAP